jgi:hypothetical protein
MDILSVQTGGSERRVKYLEFFYFFVFLQLKKEHCGEKMFKIPDKIKKHYFEISKKEIDDIVFQQKILNYLKYHTFEKELIRLPHESLEKIIDHHINCLLF